MARIKTFPHCYLEAQDVLKVKRVALTTDSPKPNHTRYSSPNCLPRSARLRKSSENRLGMTVRDTSVSRYNEIPLWRTPLNLSILIVCCDV